MQRHNYIHNLCNNVKILVSDGLPSQNLRSSLNYEIITNNVSWALSTEQCQLAQVVGHCDTKTTNDLAGGS